MPKRPYIKGNLDKLDFDRVVLTDTTPDELPIIVSNDGFYSNLRNISSKSSDAQKLITALLTVCPKSFSAPYRYRVTKDANNTRRLSLLHPSAQVSVSKFYEEFSDLICYYNLQSNFSIRAPARRGSSYFFRGTDSERNKYKNDGIDTIEFDKRVRNPSSYFAYRGYNRIHQFFNSARYSRLEKKFPIMWMGDVSKCFDSIYTHSITWALKSIPIAKKSIGKRTFGSEFDRLMQKMNYNETNGICIGPEVSRIFAETIFQRIDINVERRAAELGYINRKEYECVRYVDDIIVFAKDQKVATAVYGLFEDELGHYKLHLNDLKLTKLERPFQTNKSAVIHKALDKLRQLQEQMGELRDSGSSRRVVPRRIFRPTSLKLRFINDIKVVCRDVGVGYDYVSNYIISALANKLEDILEAYSEFHADIRPSDEDYLTNIHILIDLGFHFYTLHPTVKSSFRLSKAIVIALDFVEKVAPLRKTFLVEQIVRSLNDLIRTFSTGTQSLATQRIPVEVMNIVLAIGPHDSGQNLPLNLISEQIFPIKSIEYFSGVNLLYFASDKPVYKPLIDKFEKRISEYLSTSFNVTSRAHDAHLALDLICCPYLEFNLRMEIVKVVWEQQDGMGVIGEDRRRDLVLELESEPWFVQWSGLNLLNMLRRKELSDTY